MFKLRSSDLDFIQNKQEFLQNFEQACKYNFMENFLLKILFVINFAPLHMIFRSIFKFQKITKVKNLLKNFTFVYKENKKIICQVYYSANMSSLILMYIQTDQLEKENYEYDMPFPRRIKILGIGSF